MRGAGGRRVGTNAPQRMCWSFEASVAAACFSTAVALYLLFMQRNALYKLYAVSLLGVTSMQVGWSVGRSGRSLG